MKGYAYGFQGGDVLELGARTLGAYAEVGVLRGMQVQVELPYVWSSNQWEGSAVTIQTSGIGSSRFGIGARPPKVNAPISLHVFGRFPPPGEMPVTALQPQLGEPQVDIDVVGAAGLSAPMGKHRMWALAEPGWRHRTTWTPWTERAAVDGDDFFYRAQLGSTPRWGDRDLGWVEVHANGSAGTRSWHQVGGGIAIAVTGGLHAEVGADATYAAGPGSVTGWAWTAGISHKR